MQIAFFTNFDLHSNLALNYLLPVFQKHKFDIFITTEIGSASRKIDPLRFLGYLEKQFLISHLFPRLESGSYDGFQTFNQIKEQYNVSVFEVNSIDDNLIHTIQSLQPDLFIVVRFRKIFKGPVLKIPKYGIINLHSAMLPDFRGVMGTFRALQSRATKVGATIHYIQDADIDTGDILGHIEFDAQKNRSVLWHTANLYEPACHKLGELIEQITHGKKLPTIPQARGGAYYSFPQLKDIEELKSHSFLLYSLEEYAELISKYYRVDREWVLHTISSDPLVADMPAKL